MIHELDVPYKFECWTDILGCKCFGRLIFVLHNKFLFFLFFSKCISKLIYYKISSFFLVWENVYQYVHSALDVHWTFTFLLSIFLEKRVYANQTLPVDRGCKMDLFPMQNAWQSIEDAPSMRAGLAIQTVGLLWARPIQPTGPFRLRKREKLLLPTSPHRSALPRPPLGPPPQD